MLLSQEIDVIVDTAIYWIPENGRRKREAIFRRHGMEPAGSPVTETDGDFSSPNAPRGTGRT